MELRPYQKEAVASVEGEFVRGIRSTLIVLATGCHAIGSKVLTADGDAVAVENVHVGDCLLGMDGTPRRVIAVHHGEKPCYEITPTKGNPFVVTEDHVLSLVKTTIRRDGFPSQAGGGIVDVSVKDYISRSRTFKHQHKLFRPSMLDFPVDEASLPIPPYIVGVLLGDGGLRHAINVTTAEPEVLGELRSYAASLGYALRAEPAGLANTWIFQTGEGGRKGSRLRRMLAQTGLLGCGSGEKHIPRQYLTASSFHRLELLAGLVDTDGSKSSNGSCDYITKSPRLADGICFLCRSLGLAAYSHPCEKTIKSIGFRGTYYRVSISGDLSVIPTRVPRRKFGARLQKKSVLRTGFSVRPVGVREYFGFTVDGDNRYLLDDFTVTHNCGKTIVFSHLAAREVRRGGRVLILAHRGELLTQAIDKLRAATGIEAGLEKAEETSAVGFDDLPYTVVVGSVQSMKSQKRLARFAKDEFSLIVIDECHHALTGTYRAVIDHFPEARLLGVTATPDRGDLRDLSEVFQTIAYEYSIVDAIKGGYLSPVYVQTVPLRIDLSGVSVQSGDFQAASLGSAIDPYLRQICREIKERCHDRKTIVFTPLIATSRKMLSLFGEEGVENVREVNGESPDRAETLSWFANAPKGCVLLNSMLLTEGYDEPSVDCIVVLRATKVRALFCLDESTEVLTRDGWKRDVAIDEDVLAFDTATGRTLFTPVLAKVRRKLADSEYFCSMKGQSSDIRVTNRHRMVYDNKRRTGWKFKEAQDLAALRDGAYVPVCGSGIFRGVPLTDAELTFIGWVMTDGSISKSTNGICITQGSSQKAFCKEIEDCIRECGFKFTRKERRRTVDETHYNAHGNLVLWTVSKGAPRGRDKNLTGWGRLEPWLSKDLHPALFDMTERQFDIMLKAIWHGAGNKHFSTSFHIEGNRTFIERLQMMAIQRGWRASVSVKRQNEDRKHDLWYLHAKKQGYVKVGSVHGKHGVWKREERKNEVCWCVETKFGTVVTRRNGKVAILGNCQMVGRGTRLAPNKKNLLLLDFLWLTASHDLCRPACLLSDDPEVCETITKRQEKCKGGAELELSPETLEDAQSETVRKREDALAKRLAAQSRKKGKLFDALQFAELTGVTNLSDAPTAIQENDRPTMEMVDRLERLGFACPGSQTAAEQLLTAYQRRVDSGLSSHKQIRLLTSRGFRNVSQWPFAAAKKMIDKIAACGWRNPRGIDPETYAP